MNIEIATKWVAALRSGEFQQAKQALNVPGVGMCCLGVLCELYRRETGDGEWVAEGHIRSSDRLPVLTFVTGNNDGFHREADTGVLTGTVARWAGLQTPTGSMANDVHPLYCHSLSQLNDAGKTFAEIADLIEKHAEQL